MFSNEFIKVMIKNVSLGVFLLYFLTSCDQGITVEESTDAEQNVSSTDIPPVEIVKVPKELTAPKQAPKPPELPKPAISQENQPKDPPPIRKEEIVLPKFSEELLKAVQNWKRIPPSVFPLRSVRINDPVNFKIYSSQGQIIGNSSLPAGKEVVALGVRGDILTVSPSANSKQRGTIRIEKTDFKQGVAYLFEVRKRQRELFEKEKQRKLALAKNGENPSPSENEVTKSESSSLFEDLPGPGDFGHGKFCICNECREKRLAQTGSLK